MAELTDADAHLRESLLAGDHTALARVITKIEDREPGYRDLLAALHAETGTASIVGVTGSPGTGKSTLVDALTKQYREAGETVGVIAVDPSSPYTGGSVLGDRIRMGSTAGDMDVFVRSMSARGRLGGLSMATADAVKALDAFGKDRIIVETVGAGQNEVDIVETAETVAVVVQPGSGDDVQLLKAGILEIGDLFVVNKADKDEAAGTVADLETMLHMASEPTAGLSTGHHGPDMADSGPAENDSEGWTPPVIETVATTGEGIDDLRGALDDHQQYLADSGEGEGRRRRRAETEIRRLLRADVGGLAEQVVDSHGGMKTVASRVARRETDPYTVVGELVDPLESAVEHSIDAESEASE
ncbi:MAG: methylmalonyl Co-A mutase-associated GTPase MeaB [Halohasta sp.]